MKNFNAVYKACKAYVEAFDEYQGNPEGRDLKDLQEVKRAGRDVQEAFLDEESQLFEDRTPAAAASQMARVLAWIAECELATLSRYERLASSSKSETERHQKIASRLVRHCRELNVQPVGLGGKECPRLEERLAED